MAAEAPRPARPMPPANTGLLKSASRVVSDVVDGSGIFGGGSNFGIIESPKKCSEIPDSNRCLWGISLSSLYQLDKKTNEGKNIHITASYNKTLTILLYSHSKLSSTYEMPLRQRNPDRNNVGLQLHSRSLMAGVSGVPKSRLHYKTKS